jgi:hypothetical protein
LQLLNAAMARTRDLYATPEKQALFDGLKSFLGVRQQTESYEETARRLGVSPGVVKNEIHRLRQAFRLAMRMEIGQTVSAPHEVDGELRHLRAVLASNGMDSVPNGET